MKFCGTAKISSNLGIKNRQANILLSPDMLTLYSNHNELLNNFSEEYSYRSIDPLIISRQVVF